MAERRFSVVLAALDDYSIVEQVHLCLEEQTIRECLEVILVCRSEPELDLPEGFDKAYPDILIIEGGENVLLNEARELGVRRASTPYVLLLEDHCLPFADCLEEMLARLEQGWAVVGPGIVHGNTDSKIARAANLLTYGQWMGWDEGGERPIVAGFNSAFSVPILLHRDDRLTEDLVAPSTLLMELAREGHRFYFEPRAVMAHWESSGFDGITEILAKNGRGLGMLRARNWSGPKKLFFSLLIPLLTGYRFSRAVRSWRRAKERSGQVLLLLFPFAFLWTFGELRGYWCRDARDAITGVGEVEKNRQRYVDDSVEPIRKPF